MKHNHKICNSEKLTISKLLPKIELKTISLILKLTFTIWSNLYYINFVFLHDSKSFFQISREKSSCGQCLLRSICLLLQALHFLGDRRGREGLWRVKKLVSSSFKQHFSPFDAVALERGYLSQNEYYQLIWQFWFRNIFERFLPFFYLIITNILLVRVTWFIFLDKLVNRKGQLTLEIFSRPKNLEV